MRTGVRRAVAGVVVLVPLALAVAWARDDAELGRVSAAAAAGYLAEHPDAGLGSVSRWGESDGCALVEVPRTGGSNLQLVVRRQGGWWVYVGRSTVDLDGSPLPEVCRPGSDLLGGR